MIERAGEQFVVPVEEAVEQAAAEAPLVETTTTPVIEVIIDKAYSFQEQLLRSRIQVDQLASQRRRAHKEEALHRSLLAARLSMEKKSKQAL